VIFLSPLDLTLTKNAPVTPLFLTLTKSLDLKSFRFTLLQKWGRRGVEGKVRVGKNPVRAGTPSFNFKYTAPREAPRLSSGQNLDVEHVEDVRAGIADAMHVGLRGAGSETYGAVVGESFGPILAGDLVPERRAGKNDGNIVE
jgi:hypothetical protein